MTTRSSDSSGENETPKGKSLELDWSQVFTTILFSIVICVSFFIRWPLIDDDFNGLHDWKNIRHYGFAQGMIDSGNPIVGHANFTQPEVNTEWFNRITESPWVDWSLIPVYLIFGRSVENFHLTFVFTALLTLTLFYLIVSRYTNAYIALFGAMVFSFLPVNVYFSTYSLGENFLQPGMLLWLAAAHLLLSRELSYRNCLLFLLACANLFMAKITTGFMLAAMGFLVVSSILVWRHRDSVLGLIPKYRGISIVGISVLFIVPIAVSIKFFSILNRDWIGGRFPIFEKDYLSFIFRRWSELIGTPLLFVCFASLVVFALIALVAKIRRTPGLNWFERLTIILTTMVVIQWMIQSEAYRPHEYYMMMFTMPAVLLTVALMNRLMVGRYLVIKILVWAVFLSGFLYHLPQQIGKVHYLYSVENISENDREALRTFFKPIKKRQGKVFVFAQQPRWAYHADVYMHLVYNWDGIKTMTSRNSNNVEYLKKIRAEYVIYPKDFIPEPILKKLDSDPIVDLGPDHFKLGMVHRGSSFMIFKLTEGIAWRKPFPLNDFETEEADRYPVSGSGLTVETGEEKSKLKIESGDDEYGTVSIGPGVVTGDAILYRMKGAGKEHSRVELLKYGEVFYKQYPSSADELQLFAVGVQPFYDREVVLKIVDSYSWKNFRIEVSDFEEILYKRAIRY